MGGAGYAGACLGLERLHAMPPARAFGNAAQARAFFEHWFAAVSVSAGDEREGLFTGYYEPQLNASRTRHGAFQTAVYSVPDDLVSVDLGAFRTKLHGEHIAGRVEKNRLVPYDVRAEIDAKGLAQR